MTKRIIGYSDYNRKETMIKDTQLARRIEFHESFGRKVEFKTSLFRKLFYLHKYKIVMCS